MPHPGITLAVAVGVALGAIIYYLLPSNWEQPFNYEERPPNYPAIERKSSTSLRKRYNGNCSICLATVEGVSNSKKLNCGHVFHEYCIATWLRVKQECPNCREMVAHQ